MLYRCILLFLLLSHFCAAQDQPHQQLEDWGQVIDPDGDCRVLLEKDVLTIEYGPGGHGLDAETKDRMNAPRVVQSLEGDFSIQVTVDGNLPLPELDGNQTRAYISGGLVLLQNDQNYIRLERASFTRNGTIWHYTNFEQRIDAKRTRMGRFADFPLQDRAPVQLRLEVKGENVRALVRHVGDDWHELGKARIEDRGEILAGVSGVKTDADKATVVFRDLEVEQKLVPVEAMTESDIDLNAMKRFVQIPQPANKTWRELIAEVERVQNRARRRHAVQTRTASIDRRRQEARHAENTEAERVLGAINRPSLSRTVRRC